MAPIGSNNAAVVWGVCFLWISSILTIICATFLFLCISDVLGILKLDVILALSLLSGLLMVPPNVYILYKTAKGENIKPNAMIICCPLWLSIASVIIINIAGACTCSFQIYNCWSNIKYTMVLGMKYYKSNPKYKHFIDTLQWAVKCCGVNSYTDWFKEDWYDRTRDYDWDINSDHSKDEALIADSVPLSCCKSGNCISNYLMEMGTDSIYSTGCVHLVYKLIMTGLIIQLAFFAAVFTVEVLILCCLNLKIREQRSKTANSAEAAKRDVKHIVNVNPCFESSCGSTESMSEDSQPDDFDSIGVRLKD